MVVKRNTTDKPGRALAGLDDVNKAVRGGGLMNFGFGPSTVGGKRSGMSCKGVVDITDVVATDVGDGGMHLLWMNLRCSLNNTFEQISIYISRNRLRTSQSDGHIGHSAHTPSSSLHDLLISIPSGL